MYITKSLNKRVILSIVALLIGVAVYCLFNNNLLTKSNIIYTIIRNYLSDVLWVISFFFIAIIFSKNITKRYILLTTIFVFINSIFFEILQYMDIVNGTFDFIDIIAYFSAILISILIEKKFMEE